MLIDDITPYAKKALEKIEWLKNMFKPFRIDTSTFDGTTNCGYIKDANFSDEYTRLIKLSAKLCDRFASDILIDIKSIEDWLNDENMDSESEERVFFFGFRKDGVDHEAFIESKVKNTASELARLKCKAEYRSLYAWYFCKIDDGTFDSLLFGINI